MSLIDKLCRHNLGVRPSAGVIISMYPNRLVHLIPEPAQPILHVEAPYSITVNAE